MKETRLPGELPNEGRVHVARTDGTALVDYRNLWTHEFAGEPLTLFSPPHLLTLAVVGLLCGSFVLIRGPRYAAIRATFRYTAAALLIGIEGLLHLWVIDGGEWNVQTMLPLQLCTLSGYCCVAMLLTRRRFFYEYAYFLGLGGALPALLTPALGPYGFPHFRFWEYVLSHGLLVCTPLYMTLAEGYRPRPGSVLRVFVAMNVLLAGIGLLNWWIGSNYLFLCDKPWGPTLFDLLGPWPWYLVSLEGLGVLVVLLLYAPFALRDWLTARRRLRRGATAARAPETFRLPGVT
jgi:hypothetical integral membrane protein (TIGR02206 family)